MSSFSTIGAYYNPNVQGTLKVIIYVFYWKCYYPKKKVKYLCIMSIVSNIHIESAEMSLKMFLFITKNDHPIREAII